MYTAKVVRFRDGKASTAQASSAQILLDHLKASTARHGFEMEPINDLEGDLSRDGIVVGEYWIYYGIVDNDIITSFTSDHVSGWDTPDYSEIEAEES